VRDGLADHSGDEQFLGRFILRRRHLGVKLTAALSRLRGTQSRIMGEYPRMRNNSQFVGNPEGILLKSALMGRAPLPF
jgi:hypothetical protein